MRQAISGTCSGCQRSTGGWPSGRPSPPRAALEELDPLPDAVEGDALAPRAVDRAQPPEIGVGAPAEAEALENGFHVLRSQRGSPGGRTRHAVAPPSAYLRASAAVRRSTRDSASSAGIRCTSGTTLQSAEKPKEIRPR